MLQLTTIFFLIASSILATLHSLSLALYLYWRFPWLDMPMHVLGGSVAALGLFTYFDLRRTRPAQSLRLPTVLGFVLLVALAWEGYEFAIGVTETEQYWSDTLLDVICGLFGGYIGYLVARRLHKLR